MPGLHAGPSPAAPTDGEKSDHLVSYLETIPDDIFNNVASRLDLPALMSLETSRTMRSRVDSLGIPTYLLNHPLAHTTISPNAKQWPASQLVRHNHRIDRQIANRKWHAAQIGPAWPQAVIPVISLTEDRVLVGAGGKLVVNSLSLPRGNEYGPRTIERERVYAVTKKLDGSRGDIVGIAPLTDGQVVVAQFDGTVQRLSFDNNAGSNAGSGPGSAVQPRSTAHYSSAKREAGTKAAIHTLAQDGDTFMTTTSSPNPSAYIYSARSPWKDPVQLSFPTTEPRAWSSLITTSSGYLAPSVMLGLSSNISIYDLPTSSSSSSSSQHSTAARTLTGPDPPSRSSAYDIHLPPPGSVHHPSTLLSAWFDSHLRLHDLRSPHSEAVSEFSDPWTWADGSAMYSSAFFGEYGIAGGGARHGTVCLFDTRYPKKGWSVFSPQGKGSPVYDLAGEGGRLWGVTEKRAFVLAFDGSGDRSVQAGEEDVGGASGLLSDQLMQELHSSRTAKFRGANRGRDAVSGWTKRGGRWGWTVRYDEDDGRGTGYEHSQRGVDLFYGLPLV